MHKLFRNPFRSMRLTISPTSPRSTASGLHMMNVLFTALRVRAGHRAERNAAAGCGGPAQSLERS